MEMVGRGAAEAERRHKAENDGGSTTHRGASGGGRLLQDRCVRWEQWCGGPHTGGGKLGYNTDTGECQVKIVAKLRGEAGPELTVHGPVS